MLGSINDSTCLESLWSRGMTNHKTIGCKYQLVKDRKKVSEREKRQKRHFNYLYVKSKKKAPQILSSYVAFLLPLSLPLS